MSILCPSYITVPIVLYLPFLLSSFVLFPVCLSPFWNLSLIICTRTSPNWFPYSASSSPHPTPLLQLHIQTSLPISHYSSSGGSCCLPRPLPILRYLLSLVQSIFIMSLTSIFFLTFLSAVLIYNSITIGWGFQWFPKWPFCLLLSLLKINQKQTNERNPVTWLLSTDWTACITFRLHSATLQGTNNWSFHFSTFFLSLIELCLVSPKSVHLKFHTMIVCLPIFFFWVKIIPFLPRPNSNNTFPQFAKNINSSIFNLSWYLWYLSEGLGKAMLCFIIPSSLSQNPF